MTFWMILWKICLIGSLLAFAIMAVLVTVGGAYDIGRLLARLKDD